MTTITIRNIPNETHAELTVRAASHGQSLQEFLRSQLISIATRTDAANLMSRVRTRKDSVPASLPAKRILQYRDRGRR